MRRPRILAVGMLPPPLGGQAIMFQQAIDALRQEAEVDVVDIQAQANIGQAGLISTQKVTRFAELLLGEVARAARAPGYDLLYYCPAGPNRMGLLKDLAFMRKLRRNVARRVYHFHATGSGAFIERQNPVIRRLAERILFQPDLAIRCADVEPNDAVAYRSRRAQIIANGIADPFLDYSDRPRRRGDQLVLTFVGAVVEEKGVFDLVDVVARLRDHGLAVLLNIVGEGLPVDLARLDASAAQRGIAQQVRRWGVLAGRAKFDLLFETDIFVFPSFFRSETQPLAVIEAQAMAVPTVAYDWRGLSSIIDQGSNGFLVPLRDQAQFAERVAQLGDAALRANMAAAARRKYLERFTLDRFAAEVCAAVIRTAAAPPRA